MGVSRKLLNAVGFALLFSLAWVSFTARGLSRAAAGEECRTVPRFEPTSVPLTVTNTDAVSGSVSDGLEVQAAGAIQAVSLAVDVGEEIRQVHLGALLPAAGFPVFLLDEVGGRILEVEEGQSLPLDMVSPSPRRVEAKFVVAGPGGGFAGDVPSPLLVLGLTPRQDVRLRLSRWEAYAVDGVEITSVFRVGEVCLETFCEEVETEDHFSVPVGISLPEVEDRSILEGFPLLLQAAGQVQAIDLHIAYDPQVLTPNFLTVESFFLREGCTVALLPPRGPGSILAEGETQIFPSDFLREPGDIFLGLSVVGLCAHEALDPGDVEDIVALDFSIRPDVARTDDVHTQIEMGPDTRLFGTDGAPLSTFFDRTASCLLFPGRVCPTDVTCELTEDCLGAVISWDNSQFDRVEVFRDGLLLEAQSGDDVRRVVDPEPGIGEHTYALIGTIDGFPCEPRECTIDIPGPLECPEDFQCQLVNRLDTLSVELSWVNAAAYDSLEVSGGGHLLPVAPGSTSATILLGEAEPVPLGFTLRAALDEKSCETRCELFGGCLKILMCSTQSDGRARLDWEGGGMVTVSRFDPFTGEMTTLAAGMDEASSLVDDTPPGEFGVHYVMTAVDPESGELCGLLTCDYLIPQEGRFVRGDVNISGPESDISDAVFLLLSLFTGTVDLSCLDAADTNDDGKLNVTDAIFLLRFLFLAGSAPPHPFESCGFEVGTSGGLGCERYDLCSVGGSFPSDLDCVVDGPNVTMTWTPGEPPEGGSLQQFVRVGARPAEELAPEVSEFAFTLGPEEFRGEVPVFLVTSLGDLSRALSCVVATPLPPTCPGSFTCHLDSDGGVFVTTWDPLPAGVTFTIVKDTGLAVLSDSAAGTASLVLELGDLGRVVTIRLESDEGCSELCQVEVPNVACPSDLGCQLDMERNVLVARWTAGVGLESETLLLRKGDALPLPIAADLSEAEVSLSEDDRGTTVTVVIETPEDGCSELECSVEVPAAPVHCPTDLECAFDGSRGILRLSWTAGTGFDSLRILRGGDTELVAPADAEAVNLELRPEDFGTDVTVTLEGLTGDTTVCQVGCVVSVPPPLTCPSDFSCSYDPTVMSITVTWTAGTGLQSLLLFKDDIPVLPLSPQDTFAEVPVDPGDLGSDVTLRLDGSDQSGVVCQSECVVSVPPRLACPSDFTCSYDPTVMTITATWTAGTGLQSLLLFKDGIAVLPLSPQDTFAEIPVDPGDFGREVSLLLEGSDESGPVCESECLVFVPPF